MRCPSLAAILFIGLSSASASAQDWEHVRPDNTGIPGDDVHFVRFGPQGRMWVGARSPAGRRRGGIGIFDFATRSWTTHGTIDSPIPGEFVNDLEFDSAGVAWIGTDGGLLRFDGVAWTLYDSSNTPMTHDNVTTLAIDGNDNVWVNNTGGPDGQLFVFDGSNWTGFQVGRELPWNAPWLEVADVLATTDGHVWIVHGILDGAAEYDGTTWTLRGGSVGRFGTLVEDRAGNVWLGPSLGGSNAFWRHDGLSFTRFDANSTPIVAGDAVSGLGVDDDGTVHAGTSRGLVIETTDGGGSWSVFTDAGDTVAAIVPDPSSTDVWIMTPGSVQHHDGTGDLMRTYTSRTTGQLDYWVQRMALDAQGNMWFTDWDTGASRFDGERWINFGSHDPNGTWEPLADGAEGIFGDGQGNVWIGTNGILRWDGTDLRLWDWRNTPSFGPIQFHEFGEDRNGDIWAASESDLYRWDGADWQRFPDVAHSKIVDIANDSRGNTWACSRLGLHRWDGVQWETIATTPAIADVWGANAMAIGPDDVIWIGTNNGLLRVDGSLSTHYPTTDTPLAARQVRGVDVRPDGILGLSAETIEPLEPWPSGVALVTGPIGHAASWLTWHHGASPLVQHQIGRVKFDADGDLWVSQVGDSTMVLRLSQLTDGDGDGRTVLTDCDDADGTVWTQPGETGLLFYDDPAKVDLRWSPPANAGALPDALTYSVLRSRDRANLDGAADCLVSAGVDTWAADLQLPGASGPFYYVVRAENTCGQGLGGIGWRSDRVERVGRACP